MTKAIIFDLNGVFIQSPKLSDRFQASFGVPVEDFLAALKDVMAQARRPHAGDSFALWQPYLAKWNVSLTKEEFFDFWFTAEKEVPELIEYAGELKKDGYKVFILSNNFEERAAYYAEHFPFLAEIFDNVYYSWQTGFVKPSKEAFQLVLQENNLKPEECIFFDDSQHNIEVAHEIGLKAFIYEGLEKTKEVIAANS